MLGLVRRAVKTTNASCLATNACLALNLRVTGLTRNRVQVTITKSSPENSLESITLNLRWPIHGTSEQGGYVRRPCIGARHVYLTDDVIGRYCQHWSDEEKSELLSEHQAVVFDLTLGSENFEWIEHSSVLASLRGS